VRGAARAIGWEFRRHHRWGLMALGGYVVVFWAMKFLILGPAYPIKLDPPNGMAGWVIAPVSATFFYFVGVFSYGLAGDLAARQSIYPARMFTLPVTTAALAGWPMLYGTAAASSLWLAVALFLRWPVGIDVPLPFIWPALLTSAYLAWTQAFMWMPYGLPGLRVIVAALWLAAVDAIVLVAVYYKASELRMAAILAPQIPLAYLVACFAVARARRGDVPDWRGMFARAGPTAGVLPRGRDRFLSPARAQTWFEWRRHGRSLPALVGIVVLFELLLLFIPGNDTAPVVFATLFVVLLTPPFMAVVAAAAISKSDPHAGDSYGVTSFMATRPLTSAALIAAKLKMTIWSTLAAWLVVLVSIPVALTLSGTLPVVIERARAGIEVVGTLRAIAIVLLGFSALLASTWKHFVQSLCIGLTGREWIIKSTVLLGLMSIVAVGMLSDWIVRNRNVQSAIWHAFPWILVALVCCKLCAAYWIAIRLYDRRVLSDRTLVTGAACWLAAVVALYGLLEWFVSSPIMPRYFLGAVAILEVPLARVSAAPLALAWNRHR
jgi:hypothetical protein